MSVGSREEENRKDAIIQELHDILEREGWGGNDESLIVELVFSGRLDCRIFIRKKLRRIMRVFQ